LGPAKGLPEVLYRMGGGEGIGGMGSTGWSIAGSDCLIREIKRLLRTPEDEQKSIKPTVGEGKIGEGKIAIGKMVRRKEKERPQLKKTGTESNRGYNDEEAAKTWNEQHAAARRQS